MAQALGAHFLDEDGREIPLGGSALARLASIDPSRLHPGLAEAEVTAATDVNNPLCGPTGASEVYGPQKGATPAVVKELEQALHVYADVLERRYGQESRGHARSRGGRRFGCGAYGVRRRDAAFGHRPHLRGNRLR